MTETRRTTLEEVKVLQKYVDPYEELKGRPHERKELLKHIHGELNGSMSEFQIRTWINYRIYTKRHSEQQGNSCSSTYQNKNDLPVPFPNYQNLAPPTIAFTSTVLLNALDSSTTIYHNNCVYQKRNIRNGKKYIKTIYYKCRSCPTTLKIGFKSDGDSIIKMGKTNFHTASCFVQPEVSTRVEIILNELKERAISLFRSYKGEKSSAGVAAIVAREALQHQIENPGEIQLAITQKQVQRWIDESIVVPPRKSMYNPLPESILKPDGVNEWVRYAAFYPDTIIIFFTNDAKRFASHTPRLLIDGTFKTAPSEFGQVVNGTGFDTCSKKCVPIFHALIKNGTEKMYTALFNQIFQILCFNQLDKVIFDFEIALINAIKRVFTLNSQRPLSFQGCYFHFMKCQREAMEEMYGKPLSPLCSKNISLIAEAPFLSYENLHILFNKLREETRLKKFFDYFESTWFFGGRFSPDDWNTFGKIDENYMTNDGVERFHKDMHDALHIHPSLQVFATKLYYLDLQLQGPRGEGARVDYEHDEKSAIMRIKRIIPDIEFSNINMVHENFCPKVANLTPERKKNKKKTKETKKTQKVKPKKSKNKNMINEDTVIQPCYQTIPGSIPYYPYFPYFPNY